ncbi:hypothetical protein ACR77J_14015 [Tissierella praeacuta]|uniref:hypothetical protein n=1 Tax=Tissierella praeacuta TaxID=43131 RepID=UPI003DA1EE24
MRNNINMKLDGKNIIFIDFKFIDFKKEYKEILKNLGGKQITIDPGNDIYYINPFDIELGSEEIEEIRSNN